MLTKLENQFVVQNCFYWTIASCINQKLDEVGDSRTFENNQTTGIQAAFLNYLAEDMQVQHERTNKPDFSQL